MAVGVLPDTLAIPLARLEPYGMMILIGVLFILPLLGAQLGIDLNVVWQLVGPFDQCHHRCDPSTDRQHVGRTALPLTNSPTAHGCAGWPFMSLRTSCWAAESRSARRARRSPAMSCWCWCERPPSWLAIARIARPGSWSSPGEAPMRSHRGRMD